MSDTSNVLKPAVNFLQHYQPFAQMSAAHLEYIAMHLDQVFFSEGDNILSAKQESNNYFYIIKSGLVSSRDTNKTLNPGACFPINALIHQINTAYYKAEKSTICYQLKYSHFEYLMQQSRSFNYFIVQNSLLD